MERGKWQTVGERFRGGGRCGSGAQVLVDFFNFLIKKQKEGVTRIRRVQMGG